MKNSNEFPNASPTQQKRKREEAFVDTNEMLDAVQDNLNADMLGEEFNEILEDAEKPLWNGCKKYTKISALVTLYNIKAKCGIPDKYFKELLTVIGDMLPEDHKLPHSMYDVKKTLNELGMGYEKIHACRNDCILYRKEYTDARECPICKESRWKESKFGLDEKSKKIPVKVLWYFPPIPRIRRMFRSIDTSKNLSWHAAQEVVNGKIEHPSHSRSWNLINEKWPEFASEPRNLRLALAADGINPYSSMSTKYSCWPVMLVNYNLPPWLCMRRKFMMLTLLISGPKQPGNDIDVFLEPLIDDLKILWNNGIEVFDSYHQEKFTLKAILMWTINDFPAYGNLSGHAVKGYFACPVCSTNTYADKLAHSHKMCYRGHRKFLPLGHKYRNQRRCFDGTQEYNEAPLPPTGDDILKEVEGITFPRGKSKEQQKLLNTSICWRKRSIFFELEYWQHLPIRHLLDVMHIEKNVCDSILGTLLNIPGKTKDGLGARLDLADMKLRPELHPQFEDRRTFLPPACFTLSKEEKKKFMEALSNVKVPSGYSSNIKSLVNTSNWKLNGMKSHDCHTLIQQILPVIIRGMLPKDVRSAIIDMCTFFNDICKKSVDVTRLEEIQKRVVLTLCKFEKYFPPSFFDIMIHLTVHLTKQLELCGPVYLTWMYPFERHMSVLKGYVRNRNRPEGCMAECYVAEEAIEFCSEFLIGVKPIGLSVDLIKHLNCESISGKPDKGGWVDSIDRALWEQAHSNVLNNLEVVQPYIEKHMKHIRHTNQNKREKWILNEHNRTFIYWLKAQIANELNRTSCNISEELRWIAQGPKFNVIKYHGYTINGTHYQTKNRSDNRVTQNSGVSIIAKTMQFSSAKDMQPIEGDIHYYGVIDEIWDLDYVKFRIPLFKCSWVDSKHGIKKDALGFTLVDLNKKSHVNDSFILASQAKQVFYIHDSQEKQWWNVLTPPRRDYNDTLNIDVLGDIVMEHEEVVTLLDESNMLDQQEDENVDYCRIECEGTWIVHDKEK